MTISAKATPTTQPADDQWLEVTPGERIRLRTSTKETAGLYAMFEVVADPRNGAPMHIHYGEDEHFLILEGTLHMANGEERFDAPAGTAVTAKKGIPHAWANLGETPVRMLTIFSPGHIEAMFNHVGSPMTDDLAALSVSTQQFGTVYRHDACQGTLFGHLAATAGLNEATRVIGPVVFSEQHDRKHLRLTDAWQTGALRTAARPSLRHGRRGSAPQQRCFNCKTISLLLK
jgi:mannose-6-phosphate isomerase-like protein (cupin superfamily)